MANSNPINTQEMTLDNLLVRKKVKTGGVSFLVGPFSSKTQTINSDCNIIITDDILGTKALIVSQQEVLVRNTEEFINALSRLIPKSCTRIKIECKPGETTVMEFPFFTRDFPVDLQIIGDTRPVIGMSYIQGAQQDFGVRFPFQWVAPELGDGACPNITFVGQVITVVFTKPSGLNPVFFQPRNPDFNSLVPGDIIKVWNPTNKLITTHTVTAAANNTITVNGVLPAVVKGTSFTLMPCVVLNNPTAQPVGSFRRLGFNSGRCLIQGVQINSETAGIFDVVTITFDFLRIINCTETGWIRYTSNKVVSDQPNTYFGRCDINASVHYIAGIQQFVGENSSFSIESSPFGILIFSDWTGSDNKFGFGDGVPGIPRNYGALHYNMGQVCMGYNSFIGCPTVGLLLIASNCNVQHMLVDGAGAGDGIIVLYGGKIMAWPIPNLFVVPGAGKITMNPTIKNCNIGLTTSYNAIAQIQEVVMSGNGTDIRLDGVNGAKGAANNCKPDLSVANQGVLGSTIYHTV